MTNHPEQIDIWHSAHPTIGFLRQRLSLMMDGIWVPSWRWNLIQFGDDSDIPLYQRSEYDTNYTWESLLQSYWQNQMQAEYVQTMSSLS